MKFSIEWLKDYVEIHETPEELAEIFSHAGFNTEGIEYVGETAIIDLEITSNRGDCLSYIGMARELAAITGRQLKIPALTNQTVKAEKPIAEMVGIEIAESNLCGRYTARVITGVKIGPSPDWVVKRLDSVGLRSVNNVVDATNYAMLETGQPPHAFDMDKIAESKIIVRRAKKGETILSIDETDCKLNENMLIIADPSGPIAVAGVMGGLATEVSLATTNILLEDAGFDAVTVRSTSRALSLASESSFRFERIVDIENIAFASQRTAELIVQFAGGTIIEGLIDNYSAKPVVESRPETVTMRLSRLNKLLGIEVSAAETMKILAGLYFEPVQAGDIITCTVPSWRADIYREVDLIEEVGRIYGYDKIEIKDKINVKIVTPDKRQQLTCAIAKVLNGAGFYETINVTFTDDRTAKLLTGKGPKDLIAVLDITRKNSNILRPTLLGAMLEVLRANINAGNSDVRIYEIANVFDKLGGDKRYEGTKLAMLCADDLQTLRAAAEMAIKQARKKAVIDITPTELDWASAAGEIIVDGKKIGIIAAVSQKTLDAMDVKCSQAFVAEMDFDELMCMENETVKTQPLARFPAISRVLSLIVDEHICWADISGAIKSSAPAELEEVGFESIYRGRPIEKGKKSVTVSMQFRDFDGTLKHETVDRWQEKIMASLTEAASAQIRTV